ncbi:25S rRNA (uracil2843-N3)-methyltransferase [Aspergillus ibericus CBS 121593]|uniref:25S rRNA (Uridine(2843)-N(3))-methyltransferase n=1 Tax=Aspergillus ibericus CBS 121593 TaxID=1448316 RepID=A0A395GSL7_9EURO|nr:hypothetical protein BO80DRAFT_153006 [Aspergillus ibericus CBS 121593]RAK98581.1 hypothetical protein BO80DRAFT_153006 [Aspergillus ibericus CBS 121593]
MPPRSKKSTKDPKKDPKKKQPQSAPRGASTTNTSSTHHSESRELINLSTTIPLTLQQLLLNVFKAALLPNGQNYLHQGTTPTITTTTNNNQSDAANNAEPHLDTKNLIQTIKAHLYNRDFDSAFTDASEDLLRAYALRWSASRALGYVGVFRGLMGGLLRTLKGVGEHGDAEREEEEATHVVCIGGGAGAEIVALAGAWRDLHSVEQSDQDVAVSVSGVVSGVGRVTLEDGGDGGDEEEGASATTTTQEADVAKRTHPRLDITAVDIADWSSVVSRLSTAIQSPAVMGTKSHPAPLYGGAINIDFQKVDVLTAEEKQLRELLRREGTGRGTALVTLMFTLNELFSTSMAKATGFLLRLTDLLSSGTVLLVVDSPGSYSTLKLGKSAEGEVRERQYPMKFLLDHTLLSVAEGKWERVLSQDSRWWRRDAARLRYEVGEGAGLEDMRYQVHVYRRLE